MNYTHKNIMLRQNKYHPLPTKAPNHLLNRPTVGGRVHKEVQNEKFHRVTPLGRETDGCWVSSHHHMSPCCTNNATPPWVPPNAISEIHHNFHHPGFFFERRSSNSSGNVCKDHCFNICLRNLPLLLPRRMASANHRDQIWTWRISEPKSCEPKLHLSFRKNKNKYSSNMFKPWRWWMIHTQKTPMVGIETDPGIIRVKKVKWWKMSMKLSLTI